jgi:guanylate kinase
MGKLIIFSAPSGSGKTTIVKELMKKMPVLAFSVSATTRPIRGEEKDAVDYYFLNVEEFKSKIANNEFAEWEEVYENRFYGTLRSEIERIWTLGKHVVFDVDVKGGISLKAQFGSSALSVFIQAPSIEALRERLVNRQTDTEEEIDKRIDKAAYEMTFAPKFDVVVINNKLDRAISEAFVLVNNFINNKA